jgi:hypothetical protein
MPRLSPLSSLTLPWTTLKLASRFFVPLVLWFTIGQLLRYGIFYGAYRFIGNGAVPIVALSLGVLVQLAVTVAMLHSLRDGLSAIRRGDMDEQLAPWAARDEESIFDAMGRALFPFLVFYIAWGWFANDARELTSFAEGRDFAESGGSIFEQKGHAILATLSGHMYVAAIATAVFFAVKTATEWWLVPRLARIGPLMLAAFELNWTLFGLFTVDYYRGNAANWITDRSIWTDIGNLFGWLTPLWGPFKFAVLGALVWLVIAGVILGVDADEEIAVGKGRFGRRLAAMSGIHKQRSPREVLSRELREKWFPAVHGFRMVRRAGWMAFGAFAVLFTGLDTGREYLRRGIYYLLGPHDVPWWMLRLPTVNFTVDLIHDVLRICLLAAAFNLLVARVSARNATRRGPSVPVDRTAGYAGQAPLR